MTIQQLQTQLNNYRSQQLYRFRYVRSAEESFINFSSNDYFGLSQHPALIEAANKVTRQYGVGSGSSQLIAGYTTIHRDCEDIFADFLQRDRALLFGNGYLANIGVIDALTNIGDAIFQDRHNHASLLDAGRLSQAKSRRYAHNNVNDLKKKLDLACSQKRLIVSDGVFSMYGDIAPVKDLAKLSQQSNATLMIDDAHGVGVLGKNGRGTLELLQLSQQDVPILVCPLGKAFGVYGAIVAGSDALIEYLIQFARSYVYTTAIPPALAAAAIASVKLVKNEAWRREKIHELIQYFKREAKKRNLQVISSATPIQAIIIGSPAQALAASEHLKANRFLAYAMRPPSVPEKQSLLRITLNSSHTKKQIANLLDVIHG